MAFEGPLFQFPGFEWREEQSFDERGWPIARIIKATSGRPHGSGDKFLVTVECPYCDRVHHHGHGDKSYFAGHRVAHCTDKDENPIADNGYIIGELPYTLRGFKGERHPRAGVKRNIRIKAPGKAAKVERVLIKWHRILKDLPVAERYDKLVELKEGRIGS